MWNKDAREGRRMGRRCSSIPLSGNKALREKLGVGEMTFHGPFREQRYPRGEKCGRKRCSFILLWGKKGPMREKLSAGLRCSSISLFENKGACEKKNSYPQEVESRSRTGFLLRRWNPDTPTLRCNPTFWKERFCGESEDDKQCAGLIIVPSLSLLLLLVLSVFSPALICMDISA